MRAAFTLSICCLLAGRVGAQAAFPDIDDLALMTGAARSAALERLRDAAGGLAALQELERAAGTLAEVRRASGRPPQSSGCLRADEFDLDSELKLARRASSGAAFVETVRQYHDSTAQLDERLAQARRTNQWRKHFPTLKQWEIEWQRARQPRARELLLRTLRGQAIRAALATSHDKHKPGTRIKRSRSQQRTALASGAYREYVFNLMCAEDEENLHWFKQQIVEIGWFGMREYGWAADRAALLLVQHSDADPAFQASMAEALVPRLAVRDTDPENLAYLIDRVAVRAGRPQRFGTQMECVGGEWVAPQIEDRATLDERRERMNLVAYGVQRARMEGLCRD